MKSKEEIEILIDHAQQMRTLDYKEMGKLSENEEENRDEILSIQASADRLTGSIAAWKTVLL